MDEKVIYKKKYISWEDVVSYVSTIEERCKKESVKPNGVFGLPRGGLIIATLISHRLDIPLLLAPCTGCLIVDDICDSGESLVHYTKNSSGGGRKNYYGISTMFYKPNNLVDKNEIDYYIAETEGNWIVFPWEKED